MSIAKNIHLIFHNWGESTIPPLYKQCEKVIREKHPSWNITLWDDEMGEQFVRETFPEYITQYKSLTHNVQRTDFLRLALVYGLGGFYMDMDVFPLKPLDELLSHSLVLAEELTVSEETRKELNLKYCIRIANFMFGGQAGHPLLRRVIDELAKRYNVEVESQQKILDVTGPGLLTDMYWDNLNTYPDITLLRNEGRYVEMPNGRKEPCLFGEYAVHLHTGIWRKGVSLR